MGAIVYSLCALTAITCAVLLMQAYRRHGTRLLLWSALCFAGLALNNVLLVVDKLFTGTETDLSLLRILSALAAMMVLLYGLIWDDEK
jgi:uncharacterized protein DUF5985